MILGQPRGMGCQTPASRRTIVFWYSCPFVELLRKWRIMRRGLVEHGLRKNFVILRHSQRCHRKPSCHARERPHFGYPIHVQNTGGVGVSILWCRDPASRRIHDRGDVRTDLAEAGHDTPCADAASRTNPPQGRDGISHVN